LGGVITTAVLPHWGWRPVFYVGGALPLGIAFLLMIALPESPRFLSLRHRDSAKLQRILRKMDPGERPPYLTQPQASETRQVRGLPVFQLFTEGRALGTLLLWLPFFMNLLLLYFIVNWLPALLRQTRMPWYAGILGVSLFSLGGVIGSLLQGHLMNHFGNRIVLLVEFLSCILLVSSLAWTSSVVLMMSVTFVAGCFVQGAQAGINALTATFYPTSIRSTGVGWALGVGRLGSIVGPVLGGFMLLHAWDLHSIFLAGSAPAVLAALSIVFSAVLPKSRSPYDMSRL
jgi:AAHS family 4-hydroxybenzoate transporter-like MFS transporter